LAQKCGNWLETPKSAEIPGIPEKKPEIPGNSEKNPGSKTAEHLFSPASGLGFRGGPISDPKSRYLFSISAVFQEFTKKKKTPFCKIPMPTPQHPSGCVLDL